MILEQNSQKTLNDDRSIRIWIQEAIQKLIKAHTSAYSK
jgi:hypothetical protein